MCIPPLSFSTSARQLDLSCFRHESAQDLVPARDPRGGRGPPRPTRPAGPPPASPPRSYAVLLGRAVAGPSPRPPRPGRRRPGGRRRGADPAAAAPARSPRTGRRGGCRGPLGGGVPLVPGGRGGPSVRGGRRPRRRRSRRRARRRGRARGGGGAEVDGPSLARRRPAIGSLLAYSNEKNAK